jgi:hypothetical protein
MDHSIGAELQVLSVRVVAEESDRREQCHNEVVEGEFSSVRPV